MKPKELLNLIGLPVFIASLCCLAPIILVLFGLSTLSFAISLTNVLDGQYRILFILAGLIILGGSLVLYFRKRGICTLDQAVKKRNEIVNKVILIFIAFAMGYYLFFVIFLGYLGRMLHLWQ